MAKNFDIHNCDFESLYLEAEQLPADIETPVEILSEQSDKYSFKKELGQGGTKKVSHVYDNFARRDVALAELIHNDDKNAFAPFIKEAWLTAQLDHPNIIKIYDIGTKENNIPFFTMELKSGKTLKEVCIDSTDELLDIFIKICNAVSYAHSKNILHLDLKPENIQIGSFGEVLVCDWGMGRLIKTNEKNDPEKAMLYAELRKNALNHQKYVIGTPGYMAPEQFSTNSELTAKTDIFGLGALLYSLLTHKVPFCGSPEEIKQNTIAGNLISPREIDATISKSLNAVTLKAMSTKLEDRYNSVQELLNDINKFRHGYSTYAENAGFMKESTLFFKRNRLVCIILLCFLLLSVLSVGFFIIHLEQSRQREATLRKEAQESVKMYQREKSAKSELASDFSRTIQSGASYLDNRDFYYNPERSTNRALKEVKQLLTHNPENPQLLTQQAYVHFIRQNYKTARSLIIKDKLTQLNHLKELIEQQELTNGKLTVDKFVKLLNSLKQSCISPTTVLKLTTYDKFKRTNSNRYVIGYEKVVQALIEFYNKDWNQGNFHYDSETSTLTITGQGLKRLALFWKGDDRSFLRFIPISTLVINQCEFRDTSHLKGLQLKKLNLCKTNVTNIEPLVSIVTLTELIISKRKLREQQKQLLLKKVKLIEI